MPFSFVRRQVPMTVRACRSLVWAQAAYAFMAGGFVLLITALLGSDSAIPFRDGTLSGSGAIGLGLVYVGAALVGCWLAVQLGQLKPWARPGIVSLQVFLGILQLFRAFDLSVSTVLTVALAVAIVVLLFVPDSERALGGIEPA